MKTSYFANPKLKNGNYALISISVGPPRFLKKNTYISLPELAPTWEMVKRAKAGDKDFYWLQYDKILAGLDPLHLFEYIISMSGGKEPVLLCYEKDWNDCHRKYVAEWFNDAGLNVNEL